MECLVLNQLGLRLSSVLVIEYSTEYSNKSLNILIKHMFAYLQPAPQQNGAIFIVFACIGVSKTMLSFLLALSTILNIQCKTRANIPCWKSEVISSQTVKEVELLEHLNLMVGKSFLIIFPSSNYWYSWNRCSCRISIEQGLSHIPFTTTAYWLPSLSCSKLWLSIASSQLDLIFCKSHAFYKLLIIVKNMFN